MKNKKESKCLEPCICSPERVADYSPTLSSDTNQLSLLSGTPTAAKSCEREQKTDGSQGCKCGKGTSDCSIHPNTRDEWIASMQASLVRICQSLESNPALAKAREAVCIGKSSELLASFDPATCSLKMSQLSLVEDSSTSWPTWPRSGMTVGGLVYALPNVVPTIEGIDGGSPELWAAPNTMDKLPPKSPESLKRESTITRPGRSKPANLRDQVSNLAAWPTPTQRDYKSGAFLPKAKAKRQEQTRGKPLSEEVGGQLNPMWVEGLMGWPLGWTGLKQSETVKSHSKRRSPGKSSQVKQKKEIAA